VHHKRIADIQAQTSRQYLVFSLRVSSIAA
jgi:hypothetical protein